MHSVDGADTLQDTTGIDSCSCGGTHCQLGEPLALLAASRPTYGVKLPGGVPV
jgi:hypothetical protein